MTTTDDLRTDVAQLDLATVDLGAVDLADPVLFAEHDTHVLFDRLRTESPLHWTEEGLEPGFWSLTGYDDCQMVQRDPETFSSTGTNTLGQQRWHGDHGSGQMLTHTDGPRHTELRALVNKSFTPRRIAALEPYLRSVLDERFDEALEAGSVDFVDTMALLPVASIAALLGVPREDWTYLLGLTTAAFGSGDQELQLSGNARAAAAAAHAQLLMYCQDLMHERQRSPQDDIATQLGQAQLDGILTDEQAMLYFDLLLLGGNETTRHGSVGALLALIENPDQWDLLRESPARAGAAVHEVLRHVSPSKHVARRVERDVTLHGRTMRAGDDVVIWHFAANRDPRTYADPHAFDITRKAHTHLGLGAGSHYCLGAALATLELRLVLETIVGRIGSASLVEPPRRLASTVIDGFKSARVELRAR